MFDVERLRSSMIKPQYFESIFGRFVNNDTSIDYIYGNLIYAYIIECVIDLKMLRELTKVRLNLDKSILKVVQCHLQSP